MILFFFLLLSLSYSKGIPFEDDYSDFEIVHEIQFKKSNDFLIQKEILHHFRLSQVHTNIKTYLTIESKCEWKLLIQNSDKLQENFQSRIFKTKIFEVINDNHLTMSTIPNEFSLIIQNGTNCEVSFVYKEIEVLENYKFSKDILVTNYGETHYFMFKETHFLTTKVDFEIHWDTEDKYFHSNRMGKYFLNFSIYKDSIDENLIRVGSISNGIFDLIFQHYTHLVVNSEPFQEQRLFLRVTGAEGYPVEEEIGVRTMIRAKKKFFFDVSVIELFFDGFVPVCLVIVANIFAIFYCIMLVACCTRFPIVWEDVRSRWSDHLHYQRLNA